MKNLLLLAICIQSMNILKAQERLLKPCIDTGILDKWERVDNPKLSSDGNYVAYSILPDMLMVLRTDHSWKKKFHSTADGFFSVDNKRLIFQQGDSLCFVQLGTDSLRYIAGVSSFKYSGNGKWLACQLNNEIQLIDLSSGKQQRFNATADYLFDDNGTMLLLQDDHALRCINLSNGIINTIWSSQNGTAGTIIFDQQHPQLAFIVTGAAGNSVWYYQYETQKAAMLTADTNRISGINGFSKNGHWLFVRQIQPDRSTSKKTGVMVDVWNYKDLYIQPDQAFQTKEFTASINVSEKKMVQVEKYLSELKTREATITGDHVVLSENYIQEYNWNTAVQPAYYLFSLKDGTKKLINSKKPFNFSFSPHDKYLIYYDAEQQAYFSTDLQSNSTVNITKDIRSKISNEYINYSFHEAVAAVAGWEENDSSLLIYDNYDIWRLDPSGRIPAVNVTRGYGTRNHIKLRLTEGPAALFQPSSFVYKNTDTLLLTAFNSLTKYNGFYQQTFSNKADPVKLTMGPYTYFKVESQKPFYYTFDDGMKPIKAAKENVWIVKRQTAAVAPNYFVTRDFKTYDSISNIQPQKDYNWLQASLITWKLGDGTYCQGVLYKPENFDSTKKYPVIFNFYRQLSHRLYEFPYPQLANPNINIPLFVSQGYLVFTPDINYSEKTAPITVVYQTLVSAADYLSKLPFINSKKMAVQGHSWGAAQVNYLITHTNIFAAACEFAGVTDNVSSYLTLSPFLGTPEHASHYSNTEWLFGASHTLWERKNEYLSSSTVFNADKVNTPLLIIHNKNDNQISWRQGLELYMALRRLNKKVWMLQYDHSGHTIYEEDAMDYTVRLHQFMDYYLKDKQPPLWMTKGIAAGLKGIDSGLELDSSGLQP